MSADSDSGDDPVPVEADGEVLGYECSECGTMKNTREQAVAHCAETESDDEPEHIETASALSQTDVREHHRRIKSSVAPLGDLDANPTLAVTDKKGWYITRDNTDPAEDEIGQFPKKRRARNFTTDYGDVVDGSLERTLYALTSYKRPEAFERWEPARFDEDEGAYEYLNQKPTPAIEDSAAISAWGDIDLADDLKPQRPDLDTDTYATTEAALESYIDAFADLYGGRDAVYALDSVGGAYVFGAPEATLPITRYYEDDEDARGRVLSAFIERTNEYLQDAEARVNERVEGASEVIKPDWANNLNRQYKIPLTIHGDHDAVVTPLDVEDIRYREPVAVEDASDELLDDVREWCEAFTAVEHTERVDDLVATLWPDEYDEHGGWKAALDAWVAAEREREEREAQRRQAARERREERMEELGDGLEGHPVTPFMQDVYDALDAIDTADVVRKFASDGWDTGTDASGKTEFDPSWRDSDSGASCYVDHDANRFGDAGASGGGYAAKAMALGEGIIHDADDDLGGQQWGEAVEALREAGYNIPIWVPEAGSQRKGGGEYDQMPFWAVRKAAVALGDFPEDGFIEKTSDDESTYPGFPGPKSYNNALDAIEEAGLEHGRERADEGPTHPIYELLEDEEDAPDAKLHIMPVTGKKVKLTVETDGKRTYEENLDRGFWTSGTKRGRVAGRVKGSVPGADVKALKESVKSALTQASIDADEDWFTECMRSPREQGLRDRTVSVVAYPGSGEAEWVVTMLPPAGGHESEEQKLTFDEGQMHNADPGGFQMAHLAHFLEEIDLDAEEWANLKSYWLDIQERREREEDPREQAAVETFVDKVEMMTVWADEEGFSWDSRNGYYFEQYEDGEDAVLVPGRWVMNWLKDSDYGDMNFSRILQERGIMVAETERKQIAGRQNSVWPVAASATGHTHEKSHRVKDEDDEDAPEGLR
ncbi:hypothetical protein [Halococcus sp. AFM35]|uniref:hypothetical protein n=1 Tax=Halococcus sp. AFM35 TaxID=3421653 RepID=UPI003EB82D01